MRRVLFLWLAMQPPSEEPDQNRLFAIVRMNEAVDAFVDGRVSEAERGLREAINLDPSHVPAYINLARLEFARARYAEADLDYQRALELAPERSGELFYEIGVTREAAASRPELTAKNHRAELAAAATAFELAAAADPSDHRAHYRSGAIHDQLGHPTQADAGYRGCIAAHPGEYRCFLALAQLYADYGFEAEAAAVLAVGLDIHAIAEQMWAGAARIYLQIGRAHEAADAAKKAQTIDPDLIEPHYLRGMAAIELRDRKLAIESFSSFLHRPGHAEHPRVKAVHRLREHLRAGP